MTAAIAELGFCRQLTRAAGTAIRERPATPEAKFRISSILATTSVAIHRHSTSAAGCFSEIRFGSASRSLPK